MKDKLYIKSRLDSLKTALIPQSIEYTALQQARIDILSWVYNNGDIQSEQAVENKLERLQEESIALDFMQIQGLQRKILEAKQTEINTILN